MLNISQLTDNADKTWSFCIIFAYLVPFFGLYKVLKEVCKCLKLGKHALQD
jgi:hypothetical protein